MKQPSNIEGNIWKLYTIKLSKWFMVYMPIVVLFMESNGLDLRAVMTINGIYSIAVAAFEVPSGYFSDRLGRKQSLLIGTSLILLQFLVFSFSFSFWTLALGAVIGGLGASFVSGTDSALLYDTLQALDRKGDYIKWEGRTYALGTFSEAVAAIIGGALAFYYGLRMPIYVQVGISGLGIIAALLLVEPQLSAAAPKRSNKEQMQQILSYVLKKGQKLRFYIGLSTIFGLSSLLLAWFAQPYFASQQLPEDQIGYLWAALNCTVALLALTAHITTSKIAPKFLVAFILSGFVLGYAVLGYWGSHYLAIGLAALFFMYALRGIATPTFLNLINQHTPTDMRATVLSIRGLTIRLGYALFAPLLGWAADVYSLGEAFMGLSGVLLVLIMGAWGYYWVLGLKPSSKHKV